ncbi:MAG: bifunctional folylpolyglutamate synthase/dihydrofolate synthase [Oscillospiraceae bacterium]|nr:bifunctional folylpolyglutamate synthase/dihydrofolate synthase [Oscillospiraceae bacterium]
MNNNIKKYFDGFNNETKDPSLDAMEYFMFEYNNFEKDMNFIHIAGTNGKGSCAQILNNILINSGLNVGKFISPHLINYNERITINNNEIFDREIEEFIKELEPKIKKYSLKNKTKITLFELETIMALLYFYRKNADIIILETGLGGLYDCTNIITRPIVSIVTSVGLDHTNLLGSTLTEIAFQKAGIIKKDSQSIFIEQEQEVNNIFINQAKKKNNKFNLIKQDQILNYRFDLDYQYFDFENLKEIAVGLKGKAQIKNAAIAIKCSEILNKSGYNISEKNIRDGIKNTYHKARFEIINKEPLIIYDGAHNEPAIKNFLNTIDMYYKNNKRVYIVSILRTKDYKKIIEILMKDQDAEFIFTSGSAREKKLYVTGEELYNTALKYKKNQILSWGDLSQVIKNIIKNKLEKVYFCVGSFYIYPDVMDQINK